MKNKGLLHLRYIFSIVVITFTFFIAYGKTILRGNSLLLAELGNQNREEKIHSSFEKNDQSAFPTNPMELINVLRDIESMGNRTIPSDAIDEALKAFESADEQEFSFEKENK